MKNIKLFFALIVVTLITNANAQTFSYDFSTGYDGWIGDFSDYPVTDSVFYELEFQRTNMPSPLNTAQFGLKISGNNHSDDLFMFIKKKITGLLSNTKYQVLIDVDFASNAPTNAVGVGGAPGEGVTMKAGVTLIEPIKVAGYLDHYWMNIDKGNQVSPGLDMDTLGHVGVSDTTTVFTLINRNNSTHQFTITTDSNGHVWICIGTDSGFEATTTLYYKEITLVFTLITTGIAEQNNLVFLPEAYRLEQNYPNPFNPTTKISYSIPSNAKSQTSNVMVKIYDILGQEIRTLANEKQSPGEYEIEFNAEVLPSGTYFYKLNVDENQIVKKMIYLKMSNKNQNQ